MFFKSSLAIVFLSSLLCFAGSQDVNDVDVDDDLEREKKQERLRWFPADNKEDCGLEPGAEQVGLFLGVK